MRYSFDKFKTAYQRQLFDELNAVAATAPSEDAGDDEIMDYAVRLYDKYSVCRYPFISIQHALDEPRADLRQLYERLVSGGSTLQYLLRGILMDNRDSIIAARVREDRRETIAEAYHEAEIHASDMPERWQRELWFRMAMAYSYDDNSHSLSKAQEYLEKGVAAGDERCREHLDGLLKKYGTDSRGKVRVPLGQRLRNALSMRVDESDVRSSSYGVFRVSCLVVGLVAAAYLGYRCFTTQFDWQSLVNWNMMTSPLSSVLVLVSWGLYIPNWISFKIKSYDVDTNTGKMTRNRNVVNSAYEWVFPFFANLILIPFMITVALFYAIMGLFSVMVTVVPVLAAVFAAVLTVLIYRVSGKLRPYRIRKAVVMLLMAFYVAMVVWIGMLL